MTREGDRARHAELGFAGSGSRAKLPLMRRAVVSEHGKDDPRGHQCQCPFLIHAKDSLRH